MGILAKLAENYYVKHYGYPLGAAVVTAVGEYLTSGGPLTTAALAHVAGAAVVAFVFVRMNPKAGATEPMMTPKTPQ